MVNSEKLKERARELGIRQKEIAVAIGVKQPTANQKINNVRPMTVEEAEIIAAILHINDSEFADYFFSREVA